MDNIFSQMFAEHIVTLQLMNLDLFTMPCYKIAGNIKITWIVVK